MKLLIYINKCCNYKCLILVKELMKLNKVKL